LRLSAGCGAAAAFLMVAQTTILAGVPNIARLLDRTVWVDIGLGRTLVSISSKQIADLRRCNEPTMSFRKTEAGWVQTFYSGIAMTTTYISAREKQDEAGTTVFLYSLTRRAPAETIHLSKAGDVLAQETPGFRLHTFVKCALSQLPAHGKAKR
jgi:hypothetical protein